jgi:3-oxoadipate enol-lactonase
MTWEPWAAKEASGHEWRLILEAGAALGLYDSRKWLPEVNVPTAIIITTADHVVATERQRELAELVPNIYVQTIDADHDAVYARAEEFVPMLVNACLNVVQRSSQQPMSEESSK